MPTSVCCLGVCRLQKVQSVLLKSVKAPFYLPRSSKTFSTTFKPNNSRCLYVQHLHEKVRPISTNLEELLQRRWYCSFQTRCRTTCRSSPVPVAGPLISQQKRPNILGSGVGLGGRFDDLPELNTQWTRPFRTTSRLDINPFFWLFIKPVAKVTALLSGRFFRKWHQALPEHQKIYRWENLRKYWYLLILGGVSISGMIYGYYLSHLQETPVTGRKRFIVVTDDQFMKIVQHEADTMLEKLGDIRLPASHPFYKTVVEITRRLVSSNQDFPQIKGRTWTVTVLDDPDRNAFVLPTGHIFVFKGLIEATENEDQLAVVIGHELAHALLSHAAEQLSFVQLIDWMIIAVMAAIWAFMPTDGIAVVTQWFYNKIVQMSLHLPYSRKLETEADKVGLHLCAKACFDIRESAAFWTVMDCKSRLEEDQIPQFLSTHPSNDTRVKHLNFIMPKFIEMRTSCSCPKLPDIDPRDRVKPLQKKVDFSVRALQSGINTKQVIKMEPRVSHSA